MKIIFEREKTVPGLPGIILLSHGPLAAALLESASMIIGEQENVAAFGLEPSDALEDYAAAFMDAFAAFEERAVFLLDLFGGTPGNQLTLAALKSGKELPALGGLSLPMFIEACTMRTELEGEELLQQAEAAAQVGIVNAQKKMEELRRATNG